MVLVTLAALALTQAPLPPNSSQQLPPGHPPIGGSAPPAAVPAPSTGALPPNHPQVGGGASSGHVPTTAELIQKLDEQKDLKTQDRPFEISVSIGHLYLGEGRYADAKDFFDAALKKAEPVRAFWLEEKKALGAGKVADASGAGCADGEQAPLFEKAKAKLAAKDVGAAVACAQAALKGLEEVELDVAHVRFLLHDPAGAVAAFERALETNSDNHEARYGRAAVWLDTRPDDVASLKTVKAELEKVVAVGTFAHAKQAQRLLERTNAGLAAGGVSKLPVAQGPLLEHPAPKPPPMMAQGPMMRGPMMGGPMQGQGAAAPQLDPSVMAAMAQAGQSPEAQASVDGLIAKGEEALAKGQYQEALNTYKSGMPIAPNNGRLRAGLAWSLVKLEKPTADRVWGVALQEPNAIATLSDELEKKGDAAGAKALRQKLVQAVPELASRFAGKL